MTVLLGAELVCWSAAFRRTTCQGCEWALPSPALLPMRTSPWFSQGQGLVSEWSFQGSPCDSNASQSPPGRNLLPPATSHPPAQERWGSLLCGPQVMLLVPSLPTFPMAQHPGLGERRGLVLPHQEAVLGGELGGDM